MTDSPKPCKRCGSTERNSIGKCRPCRTKAVTRWRAAHPRETKAIRDRYRAAHPEVAREQGKKAYRERVAAGRCRCGAPLADKVVCDDCREIESTMHKRLRAQRAEAGTCLECGGLRNGERVTCSDCLDKLKAYRAANTTSVAASKRKGTTALRNEVLAAYGMACACCGETEPRFLTIDHVANDGAAHRRRLGRGASGTTMYRWLRDNGFPSGFQTLCMNCNFGKAMNGGECPHVTRASAEPERAGVHHRLASPV